MKDWRDVAIAVLSVALIAMFLFGRARNSHRENSKDILIQHLQLELQRTIREEENKRQVLLDSLSVISRTDTIILEKINSIRYAKVYSDTHFIDFYKLPILPE